MEPGLKPDQDVDKVTCPSWERLLFLVDTGHHEPCLRSVQFPWRPQSAIDAPLSLLILSLRSRGDHACTDPLTPQPVALPHSLPWHRLTLAGWNLTCLSLRPAPCPESPWALFQVAHISSCSSVAFFSWVGQMSPTHLSAPSIPL